MTEVPVFNLGPISEAQAKETGLADNARYGFDDTIDLAKLLGEIDDVQSYLPWSETEISSIFASSDIALDDLDLDDRFDKAASEPDELPTAKAPKTHAMMRFQVPLLDAERITKLIAKVQKRHGFTTGSELINAGDALVHLLSSEVSETE
jgi:ParB family chromosome partitioning protein